MMASIKPNLFIFGTSHIADGSRIRHDDRRTRQKTSPGFHELHVIHMNSSLHNNNNAALARSLGFQPLVHLLVLVTLFVWEGNRGCFYYLCFFLLQVEL